MTMRRSTRARSSSAMNNSITTTNDSDNAAKFVSEDNDNSDSEVDHDVPKIYMMDGVQYDTYQEMVNAKRRRNEQFLEESGLLSAAKVIKKKKAKPERYCSQ
mmetsp:Transcript_9682/g.14932  ORF Transcript_9682/g.14932 Transcript_9682/m.14932 type:complete len:102 (+) Transcript_9682:105-410(+)